MQVVILAAGDGGRLRPLTNTRPKALIDVAGTPLIDRVLDGFVAAGAREFIVVLGYEAAQLEAHLVRRRDASIRFVWNADYDAGNARSLLAAEPALRGEHFVLAMGDHLQSAANATLALATEGDHSCVFVDGAPDPRVAEEATRVLIGEHGVVRAIGKQLTRWNAVDTGLFRLRADATRHLRALPISAELNDAWPALIAEGSLRAIDIGRGWWADIDTQHDLTRAERRLREHETEHHGRRPHLAIPEP